jgi:O-methyltransferase
MNCVIPEIEAAEFFWDKLVCGGVIVLDDYGWKGHHLQKQAFDEFAAKRGIKILSLPTGQGLIIKP